MCVLGWKVLKKKLYYFLVCKLGKLVWWKIGGYSAVAFCVVPLQSVNVTNDLKVIKVSLIKSAPEDVSIYIVHP